MVIFAKHCLYVKNTIAKSWQLAKYPQIILHIKLLKKVYMYMYFKSIPLVTRLTNN